MLSDLLEATQLTCAAVGIQTLSTWPLSCSFLFCSALTLPPCPLAVALTGWNKESKSQPLLSSAENDPFGDSNFLLHCVDLQMTLEVPMNIDFGITNTFEQVGKTSHTESVNNKNQLYIIVVLMYVFGEIWRVFRHNFFNYFSAATSFSSPSGTPMIRLMYLFTWFDRSMRFVYILFSIFFSLFCWLDNFYWPIFKCTLSSVISILLLNPPSECYCFQFWNFLRK